MKFPTQESFLAEYQAAGFDVEEEGENQYRGLCPVHGDTNPSLAIGRGRKGQVLLACRSHQCEPQSVLDAVRARKPKPNPTLWYALHGAKYVYRDEAGVPRFEVTRKHLDPLGKKKKFPPARIEPDGTRVRGQGCLDGVKRLLYRLPELRAGVKAGKPVYIVEGEKDVEALVERGHVATCNPGGTGGGWKKSYNRHLKGANVKIVQDKDNGGQGQKHALKVEKSLTGSAKSVRIVEAKTGKDPYDHFAAGHTVEEFVEAGDAAAQLDLETIGFSGATLRALSQRPKRVSPLDGFLDSDPSVTVVVAKPKTGKTSLSLHIGRCWAERTAPWPGASPLPGKDISDRVLLINAEQSAQQVNATALRLQDGADARGQFEVKDCWPERTTLVARDAELTSEARKLLCLDEVGREVLAKVLSAARSAGDPFGLVVIDSLSRAKPRDAEENSNDDMTKFIDALAALATEFGVWVLLIHHAGHTGDKSRGEARSAGRGASAIEACAATAWLVERGENAQQVKLSVDGNAVLSRELYFEVAQPDDPPRYVLYFLPVDTLAAYKVTDYLKPLEQVSQTELAHRLTEAKGGTRKGSPAGGYKRLARALAQKWVGEGVATETGPHKLLCLASARRAPNKPTAGVRVRRGQS
ncbi:MAG: AAA family ATPase [Myxococcota bacterium]